MTTDTAPALPLHRPAALAAVPEEPPALRPGMVPRSRLVRRLRDARDVPVALLVAPAGYGKTTLVAEWAQREDRPFLWTSGPAAVGDALRIARHSAASPMPHVLVADDAQLADPAAVRQLLAAAGRFPAGTTLALLSRTHPGEPTGRLRAYRLLVEVPAAELAMTRLEAARLLEGAGVRLEAAQVDRLMERTEGWPAVLYLAALALTGEADAERVVAGFGGTDRTVGEYLRDELLLGLTAEQRSFLRRTSILPRMSGALCDAVLDRRGSGALLVELARRGVPLEPLDRSDIGFRQHPLLAAMLRAELDRVEPELAPSLHGRAADWHARQDEPDAAIRHALASRNTGQAARVLWSAVPAALGAGAPVEAWLERFGARETSAHPPLALAAAALHLAAGRRARAERATDVALRASEALPGGGEWGAALAMLRAAIARDGAAQMARDAERACELAPPESGWQGIGRLLEGVARQLAGDAAAARTALEDGAGRAAGEAPAVAAVCHAQLALLAVDAGEWDDAARDTDAAHALLLDAAAPAPVRALVLAVCAVVAAHRGEPAQARHDAADARRLLASLPDCVPWLAAEAHVWLARAEIRLSDGPAARVLLSQAARLQAQVPDAGALARWVHEAWGYADALAESATGDGPTLTNAELRVLRLLPSHMSFREIGARLHISPNTVKTQALSVYRKLDVSCRSEAVARGRTAGLIDWTIA